MQWELRPFPGSYIVLTWTLNIARCITTFTNPEWLEGGQRKIMKGTKETYTSM